MEVNIIHVLIEFINNTYFTERWFNSEKYHLLQLYLTSYLVTEYLMVFRVYFWV